MELAGNNNREEQVLETGQVEAREAEERAARESAVLDIVRTHWSRERSDLLQAMTQALHTTFPHFTGVYIYLLEGDTLVLSNFVGRPTEHTRIPIGAGICGRAAREGETVRVDDVTADAEYLACSIETRSEIVVPILRGEQVFGEIDIDSDAPAAFSDDDQLFLEKLAGVLRAKF